MYKDEYKAVCNSAATKLNLLKTNPLGYFVASMLAGMFVAMGGFLAFTLAGHLSTSETAAIWAKPAQSAAFAAALSLVIMAGADLFTGNNFLMSAAAFRKTATWGDACKLWCMLDWKPGWFSFIFCSFYSYKSSYRCNWQLF